MCTDEDCLRPSAKLWLKQCVHVVSDRASAKTISGMYAEIFVRGEGGEFISLYYGLTQHFI